MQLKLHETVPSGVQVNKVRYFTVSRQFSIFPFPLGMQSHRLMICLPRITNEMSPRLKPPYWAATCSLYHVGAFASGPITSLAARKTDHQGYYHRRQYTPMSTCGGTTGYYACALSVGGGCCPQGLICGANQACEAPPTTSRTTTVFCDQDWFACPSSYGGEFFAPRDSTQNSLSA